MVASFSALFLISIEYIYVILFLSLINTLNKRDQDPLEFLGSTT